MTNGVRADAQSFLHPVQKQNIVQAHLATTSDEQCRIRDINDMPVHRHLDGLVRCLVVGQREVPFGLPDID